MNVVKKIAVAVGLTFATVAAMATPVVIDDFNTGIQSVGVGTFLGTNHGTANSSVAAGSGIIGGYRKAWLQQTSSAGGYSSMVVDGSGVLDYSNSSSSVSSGSLRWDGGSDIGTNEFGLGASLLGATSIDLTVQESDGFFGYQITLWGSDANTFSQLRGVGIPVPASSPRTFNYFLSWFLAGTTAGTVVSPEFGITSYCGTSCVSMDQIGAISISLIGVNGATDLTVDSTAAVPEPASLALVGLGLLGAGFIGRRKRA